MSMKVSFAANATQQEKLDAKASAKASLLGTAVTAGTGAVMGGVIGAAASFMPCAPSISKVFEYAEIEAGESPLKSLVKDYKDKFSKAEDAFKARNYKNELANLEAIQDKGQEVLEEIAKKKEALKKLPSPEKFEELQKSMAEAYKAAEKKAKELIKNAADSDLIQNAKKATKSMRRPNMIVKGIGTGIIVALLLNIVSSFRKPKSQNENIKSFQA